MITSVRNSLSGMKLSARTVSVSASNIANARNTARLEDVAIAGVSESRMGSQDDASHDPLYTPQRVEGEPVSGGGVRAVLREKSPAYVAAYAPGDPNADQDGLVARPNVDIAEELLTVSQASTLYEATLKVLRTADDMLGTLLDNRA
jgi:flagellar basal-body rod protein FlgC